MYSNNYYRKYVITFSVAYNIACTYFTVLIYIFYSLSTNIKHIKF